MCAVCTFNPFTSSVFGVPVVVVTIYFSAIATAAAAVTAAAERDKIGCDN